MREEEATVPLKTEHLFLRRFTPQDADAFYDGWAHDAEATRFLRWNPHQSKAETQGILRVFCAAYAEDPDYYNWAICEKDGALVGSIGVMPGRLGDEIGYVIARRAWGRGYATQALVTVRDYLCLRKKGVLWCCYAVQNSASGRVIEKAGFRFDHEDHYESYDHTRQFSCRCCRYPAE